MRGINDQAEHAQLLEPRGLTITATTGPTSTRFLLNPIEGLEVDRLKPEDEQRFLETCTARGITATLRDTRGQDIDGAPAASLLPRSGSYFSASLIAPTK